MIRTLKKRGNSHALVIERPLMEQLGITPETQLQLVVNDGSLIVTPVHVGVGKERVDALMDDLRADYGDVWRELAR